MRSIISSNYTIIKHIQVAGVPGRNEPNTGKINFFPIFKYIDNIGYTDWIGCEYKPTSKGKECLSWMKDSLSKNRS